MRALEIEPDQLGANEHLGELSLQTGRPELARERRDLDDAFTRYSNGEGP